MNKIYIVEILVISEYGQKKPKIAIPKRNGFRGRFPTKVKVIDNKKPTEVRKIANDLPQTVWQRNFVGDTVRGRLKIDIAALRVHIVRKICRGKKNG